MKFRPFAVAALGAALLAGLTACQTGVTMWAACSPAADGNPTGTDGQYVVVCKDGRWEPIMTVKEYVAAARGENVTIAPLPARPAATTTAPPADPWVTALGQCWDASSREGPDLKLIGPKNTPANAQYYNSTDGTCTPEPPTQGRPTLVQANDLATAATICEAVQGVAPDPGLMANISDPFFYPVPGVLTDAWLCTVL